MKPFFFFRYSRSENFRRSLYDSIDAGMQIIKQPLRKEKRLKKISDFCPIMSTTSVNGEFSKFLVRIQQIAVMTFALIKDRRNTL